MSAQTKVFGWHAILWVHSHCKGEKPNWADLLWPLREQLNKP